MGLLTSLKHKLRSLKSPDLLADLTNKYLGQDAVIIGMGPSLKIEDLSRLGSCTSFACNRVYLAFDSVKWRPDYYTVIDTLVAQQYASEICTHDFGSTRFIHSSSVSQWLRKQTGASFYDYSSDFRRINHGDPLSLPTKISNGLIAGGCTVIIDQIQLAYIMGFKRVFLIGLDFSWGDLSGRIDDLTHGPTVKAEAGSNHFHPKYYTSSDKHTTPKIAEQFHAYTLCRQVFEADGRELINASRYSKLTAIKRMPFEDVFLG